jgi:hypothetical protein
VTLSGRAHARRRWLSGWPGSAALLFLLLLAGLSFLGCLGFFGPARRTTGIVVALYVSGSAGVALLGLRACLARSFVRGAAGAAAAALVLRLGLAWVAPLDYDLQSYAIVVNAVNHGQVVYEATGRYNYGPIWFHVLQAAARISRAAGLSPFAGFRLVTIAGDVGLALALLAFGLAGDTRRRAVARALFFWTSPIAIATSAFQGQFDTLAIAFFVAALALVRRSGPRRATFVAAAAVGAGIAIKQIVVVFLAGFLGLARRNTARLRDAALAAAPFALLLLPWYLVAPAAVVKNVLRYASLPGVWGWFSLVKLAGGGLPFPTAWVSYGALILAGALAFLAVRRGDAGLDASRMAALVFLALTPGWGFQMLVWPVALASVRREGLPVLFYAAAGMGAYAELMRVHGASVVFLTLTWLAVLAWLARLAPLLLRRPLRAPVV